MAKINCKEKKFRLSDLTLEHLNELAEEDGCSETKIVEQAINYYYTKEILPEHILMGRMNQLKEQFTVMDRKLETLSGLFYMLMPIFLGSLTLPEDIKSGDKTSLTLDPLLEKGNNRFMKQIINYRRNIKAHKISFMQNVWMDTEAEHLNMTEMDEKDKKIIEKEFK